MGECPGWCRTVTLKCRRGDKLDVAERCRKSVPTAESAIMLLPVGRLNDLTESGWVYAVNVDWLMRCRWCGNQARPRPETHKHRETDTNTTGG